jgi:hypothetical protein
MFNVPVENATPELVNSPSDKPFPVVIFGSVTPNCPAM